MRSGSHYEVSADTLKDGLTGGWERLCSRRFTVAVGSILLLFLACEPTLERRVFEYERRVNADNVEGVLELWADDGVYELKGTALLKGKEALRGLAEWDSVLQTRLTFHEMTTEGDTVLVNVVESSKWLTAVGIEQLVHPSTIIIFRGGLISRIESETDTVGTNAVNRSLDAVLSWALTARPQAVRRLVSDTGLQYTGENAALWLQLLEEWRAEFTSNG